MAFIVLEPDSIDPLTQELFDTFGRPQVEKRWKQAARKMLVDAKRQMPVRNPKHWKRPESSAARLPGGTARRSTRVTVRGLDAELNGVHYIEYLNEGSSPQAEREFIDRIVEKRVDEFMQHFDRRRP